MENEANEKLEMESRHAVEVAQLKNQIQKLLKNQKQEEKPDSSFKKRPSFALNMPSNSFVQSSVLPRQNSSGENLKGSPKQCPTTQQENTGFILVDAIPVEEYTNIDCSNDADNKSAKIKPKKKIQRAKAV